MDDLRKIVYGLLIFFVVGLIIWISFLFFVGCNGSLNCEKRQLAVERTSVPTLIPATLPVASGSNGLASTAPKCQVAAVDLLAAWINAGYPETDPVSFTDVKGRSCQATFSADIQPLFSESNMWYSGSVACITCHNPTLSDTAAQMDLSSYQGILAGSRRSSPDVKGNDILGGGNWQTSKLHEVLIERKGQPLAMPLGRPVDFDATTTMIFAGTVVEDAGATPTPAPEATVEATPTPAQ